MNFKVNLLVKSCLFGFTILGLLSYILNKNYFNGVYIGCLISLLTGILCHGTNNKFFTKLDVFAVHVIAIYNLFFYFKLIKKYDILSIMVLIFSGFCAGTSRLLRKEYIEINHFLFVHIPSFIAIFIMITDFHLQFNN